MADDFIGGVAINPTGGGGGVQVAGDIGGTDALPKVVGFQGNPVSSSVPAANDALIWNGTEFVPTAAAQGLLVGLSGIAGGFYQIPASSASPHVMIENVEVAVPIMVTVATTIKSVGIYCSTAVAGGAGVAVLLGIRNDSGNGTPGNLIQEFGSVTVAAIGYNTITLGTPLALSPGV